MKSGSADTHDLAVAAKTQSEKMSNMSDAADKIRQAAQDMVTQDQRIADSSQKAIEASNDQSKAATVASNKQSKASLEATIKDFQRDQRARVGLLTDTVSQSFDKLENPLQFPLLLICEQRKKSSCINRRGVRFYNH